LQEKQSFNIYKPQVQGVSLSPWGVVRRELCFQLPEFTRASQSRRDQWWRRGNQTTLQTQKRATWNCNFTNEWTN